jgi:threonine/homoserine/homoserine lactone efflux protein
VHSLAGFTLLAVLLSLTPGPDDVLVLRYTLQGGIRSGAGVAIGAATATLVWGGAAATGLSVVITRSAVAYQVLRVVGAVYLVTLGIVALSAPAVRRSSRARGRGNGADVLPRPHAATRRAFVAGFLSDLLNPKIAVFYLAVLPPFIPAAGPVLGWSLLLSCIDVAVATGWLFLLAGLAHRLPASLRGRRVDAVLGGVLNASLVGIGAAVAVGW